MREQIYKDGLMRVSLISQIFKILYNIFLVVGHLAIYVYNIWCHTTQNKQKYRAKQYNCPCTWNLPNKTMLLGGLHHPSYPTRAQASASRTTDACAAIRTTVVYKATTAHSWPSGQWWRARLARGHQDVRDSNRGSPRTSLTFTNM